MDQLTWLLDARLHILGSEILWREIVGNGFGFASALSNRTVVGLGGTSMYQPT